VSAGFTDYGEYIGLAYTRPLVEIGTVPMLVPYLETQGAIEALLGKVDALVLGVGRDIEATRYGGRPHPAMTPHSPLRDELELRLTLGGLDRGVPILGVCRGVQIINVALGGTLYRDRSEYPSAARIHPGGDWRRWEQVCAATLGEAELPEHPSHEITIKQGTLLSRALGTRALVNSYHHQAIRDVGRDVQPVAWAHDGIIEAIEVDTGSAACLGIQWELQESWQGSARCLEIFRLVLNGEY
jgi:putative glutamine amidotransferase